MGIDIDLILGWVTCGGNVTKELAGIGGHPSEVAVPFQERAGVEPLAAISTGWNQKKRVASSKGATREIHANDVQAFQETRTA